MVYVGVGPYVGIDVGSRVRTHGATVPLGPGVAAQGMPRADDATRPAPMAHSLKHAWYSSSVTMTLIVLQAPATGGGPGPAEGRGSPKHSG